MSVAELGILRGIEWDAADPTMLVVTVTPTYSGCPATDLIMTSIREALVAAGVARHQEVDTPSWLPALDHDVDHGEGAAQARRFRHRTAAG